MEPLYSGRCIGRPVKPLYSGRCTGRPVEPLYSGRCTYMVIQNIYTVTPNCWSLLERSPIAHVIYRQVKGHSITSEVAQMCAYIIDAVDYLESQWDLYSGR